MISEAYAVIASGNKPQLMAKRVIDLAVTIPVFILLLPIFAVIGFLIKLETQGPVLFADKRLGVGGRVFNCYKFRTMLHDSEHVLKAYLEGHPEARQQWALYKKLPDDPRVTRVGRFLRKTTLDEFPQVINIIRGEMSIIGPRPFMLRETGEIEPYIADILTMSPGMAGMWIAHGRNNLTFEERIRLEVQYVRNWSLKLDFVLFWKSFIALVLARGAH
jgi:lipopolysaccharide/colanic/teichoic acid biosynthesis glycosyltransferase